MNCKQHSNTDLNDNQPVNLSAHIFVSQLDRGLDA